MRETESEGEHERLYAPDRGKLIKDTLRRVTPISSEYESTLRDMMIDSALGREDMRRFFPTTPISDTTETFLQDVVAAEIAIAQALIDQPALLKRDRPAFIALLCDELTEEEQALCQESFAQLREAPHFVERYLRFLNGESHAQIGADHGSNRSVIWKTCTRLKGILETKDERMRDILERLTPHFPHHTKSIIEDLPECLPYIDFELSALTQRREQKLDEEAFSYLARSLVDSNINAREALLIIAKLKAPRLLNIKSGHPLYTMNHNTLRKYKAHQAFFQKFQIITPNTYEHSDEATDLLLQAIAAQESEVKKPPPLKIEVIAYAKDIEAGVLAEELLTQDEQDWNVDATREELQQLKAIGKIAIHQLLKSHVDCVTFRARRMRDIMESPKEADQLILIGMRGLLRAIRKYDYASNYTLTPLAQNIVDEYVQLDIIREDWSLPVQIGKQIISLKAQRTALSQELQEEPSRETLAKRMGLSLDQLDELLSEEVRLQHRLKGDDNETADETGSPIESTSNFGTNTELFLQQTLKDLPFGYEILEMHFAQYYPVEEIAEALGISAIDTQQRLEKAIAALTSSIEPSELPELLKHN